MKNKTKQIAEIKKAKLEEGLNIVSTADYSPEEYNDLLREIDAVNFLDPDEELPFKTQRFCQEYVVHYNGDEAAIRAGFPIWNAKQASNRLLANPRVRKEIERLQKHISIKLQITAESVLSDYAKIAKSNIKDYLNDDDSPKAISELDRDAAYAIDSVDFGSKKEVDENGEEKTVRFIRNYKIAGVDKKKQALDSLANHLGLFDKDKKEQMPVDLKTLISMFPKEIQEQIKVGLAKRIGNK